MKTLPGFRRGKVKEKVNRFNLVFFPNQNQTNYLHLSLKNLTYFILLVIFSPVSYSQTGDITVTDSLYVNYNTKEFLELENLNELIDFENHDVELINAAIFHLTNKERKKKKRTELAFSAELSKAAQFHSEQMRDKKFFSHKNTKDKEFYSMDDRIKYFGGNFSRWGENISKRLAIIYRKQTYTPLTYLELAENIVRSWMNSQGHRKTMLNPDYKYLGCGVALPVNPNKRKKYIYAYATQNFGGLKR